MLDTISFMGPLGFFGDVVEQIRLHYPELLHGYALTIILTVLSMALALLVGGVLALFRTSEVRPLRITSAVYIEVFRNTPLLVQLFFWFFALPRLPHVETHLPWLGTIDW